MQRGRLSKYAGAVMIAVVLAGVGAQPVAADEGRHGSNQRQYLALGDSLPFGFNPLLVPPYSTVPPVAADFVGYPELAAPPLKLALTNASCPGQTSAGFISLTALDNGCNAAKAAGLPLHTAYTGTQLDFAVSFLRSNPHTRLVTLSLGANDLFLCGHPTATGCASQDEFAGALALYEKNLTKILKKIRKVYDGKLVAVTYYSVNYNDPQITSSIAALNDVETRVIRDFHGTTADGFAAFAAVAAAGFGGNTCAAGLLIKYPDDTCDFHPSPAGAKVLADTLVAAVRHRSSDDNSDQEDSLVGANG